MYHPPDNNPYRRYDEQTSYQFNPPQQGFWQAPPPASPQGPYPPFSQGAYPPPPPIPGQFYSPPSQPTPNLSSPYQKRGLFTLIGAYIAFWLFVFLAAGYSPMGFAIFLGNLGISLFWGLLASILVLDWRGFFTINGWIQWQNKSNTRRVLIGLLCLMVSSLLISVYLVRAFLIYRRSLQQPSTGPGYVPSTSRRPRTGIIVGSIVTLCALFLYTMANASGAGSGSTSTLSPTEAPTATPMRAINPIPKATRVIVKPTAVPTKAPIPTPTVAPTPIPTQPPTPTAPPAPQATQVPATGVNGNPWGYNFQSGNLIYDPPANFCDYFNCIASFWKHTNGYVDECIDGTYSHSGGVSGACSWHGGEMRPLYSH
ncbi:MAG: hypothetical protein JO011_01135 [Ktedonobacteraceae bacterium]|nr:hypothetical protein [Ktedonobacteraceae bacterium]